MPLRPLMPFLELLMIFDVQLLLIPQSFYDWLASSSLEPLHNQHQVSKVQSIIQTFSRAGADTGILKNGS